MSSSADHWQALNPRWRWPLLLGAFAICCVPGAATLPLFDLDEGAFAQATLEMLASGNYALTTLDGQLRYDKPMLSYWLQALSVTLLGAHELAFRLPSLLAALAWFVLSWRFVARHRDLASADLLFLLLCTSLGCSLIARAATADALLNLCLCGALFAIYDTHAGHARVRVAFAWIALGLLTKGPIAVAIPFVASVLLYASSGRRSDWWRAMASVSGWALLLALVAPWVLWNLSVAGPDFLAGFLLHHNLGRYTTTFEGHGGGPWYYLVVLPVVVLPFSSWLWSALRSPRADFGDPLRRYCWFWFGLVMLIFSFSATQLPHYILYGTTPLLLLCVEHRGRLRGALSALAPALLGFVVVIALPALAQWALPQLGELDRAQISAAGALYGPTAWAFCTLALALLVYAAFGAAKLVRALVIVAVAQALLVSQVLAPAVAKVRQQPVVLAAQAARESGRAVVAMAVRMPSFSVYRGAPTPRRLPQPGETALVRADRLEVLHQSGLPRHYRVRHAHGGLMLIDIEEPPT